MLYTALRFLRHHPQLYPGGLVFLGESYGGMRATLMSSLLLDYRTLLDDTGYYQDAQLYSEIVDYYTAVLPAADPENASPAEIATAAGHNILVQPFLTPYQPLATGSPTACEDTSSCMAGVDYDALDHYDCSQLAGAQDPIEAALISTYLDPVYLTESLGADPTTIAWLHPEYREGAYSRIDTYAEPGDTVEAGLVSMFGALPEPDHYYCAFNRAPSDGAWGRNVFKEGGPYVLLGERTLRVMHDVDTFLTRAAYDLIATSSCYQPDLSQYSELVQSISIDDAVRPSVERPGWMVINYQAGLPFGSGTREVRFPPYLAGHSVTYRAAPEMAADVEQWLAGN